MPDLTAGDLFGYRPSAIGQCLADGMTNLGTRPGSTGPTRLETTIESQKRRRKQLANVNA
jgi:hypothetical protein